MKLKQILALVLLFAVGYYVSSTGQLNDVTGYVVSNERPLDADTITVANWNIQTFGTTKWGKDDVKATIIDLTEDYDIVFIQEIRDASQTVFRELCDEIETHQCIVSTRAGRSTSKEQNGVLYRNGIEVTDVVDYALDETQYEDFERPPYVVTFNIDEYEFTAINIHIKPDDVYNELSALEVIANTYGGNVMLLGDFNADGSYYNEDERHVFLNYNWIISDAEDTTVAQSDNTYDRIILNDDLNAEYASHGVFKDIDKSVSDHYLVWVELLTQEG